MTVAIPAALSWSIATFMVALPATLSQLGGEKSAALPPLRLADAIWTPPGNELRIENRKLSALTKSEKKNPTQGDTPEQSAPVNSEYILTKTSLPFLATPFGG